MVLTSRCGYKKIINTWRQSVHRKITELHRLNLCRCRLQSIKRTRGTSISTSYRRIRQMCVAKCGWKHSCWNPSQKLKTLPVTFVHRSRVENLVMEKYEGRNWRAWWKRRNLRVEYIEVSFRKMTRYGNQVDRKRRFAINSIQSHVREGA